MIRAAGGTAVLVTADLVVPVTRSPMPDGFVRIVDGRIAEVGSRTTLGDIDGLPVVALPGCAVFPGLIDTHCHLEWSSTTLTSGDGTFAGWLRQIMRAGLAMTPDDFLDAARAGARRALLAGTTTVLDAGPTGAGARALDELGMRGTVHLETFGRHTGDAAREAADELSERIAALPGSSRVTIGVSPHAPYTVGAEYWTVLAAHPGLAERPWMTHLAESTEELDAVCGARGPLTDLFHERGSEPGRWPGSGSIVRRMDGAGALRPGLTAAHCVHVTADDVALLAARGVGVAHCPVSNTTLGVGRHPVEIARAGGLPVGLGSDSPASGGRYDLRHEARACDALHGACSPDGDGLLEMLTIDAARVAGLDDRIGSLDIGKCADLIAVPLRGRDPMTALLDTKQVPALVMIDGETRVRGGAVVERRA